MYCVCSVFSVYRLYIRYVKKKVETTAGSLGTWSEFSFVPQVRAEGRRRDFAIKLEKPKSNSQNRPKVNSNRNGANRRKEGRSIKRYRPLPPTGQFARRFERISECRGVRKKTSIRLTNISKRGPPTNTTICTVSRGRLRRCNQTKENLPIALQFVCVPGGGGAANKLEGKWKVRTTKNHQNRHSCRMNVLIDFSVHL